MVARYTKVKILPAARTSARSLGINDFRLLRRSPKADVCSFLICSFKLNSTEAVYQARDDETIANPMLLYQF